VRLGDDAPNLVVIGEQGQAIGTVTLDDVHSVAEAEARPARAL